ncbi:MAG: hypothetical protein Q4B78_03765, partial [Bacillota bacterium]|nr:hypothetical protein [Bacillota bacterium]
MRFDEKFNTIISTVEECLREPDSNIGLGEIAEIIKEKVMASSGRSVSEAFSFITNITLGKYVTLRKIAIIIEELRENEISEKRKHPDEIIAKYYSERSAFERACSKNYGVRMAALVRGEGMIPLMEPMTLEDVLINNNLVRLETADKILNEPIDDSLEKEGSETDHIEPEYIE